MFQIRSVLLIAAVITLPTVGNGGTIRIRMNRSDPIGNYDINNNVNPPSIYIKKPPTWPYPYDIYCTDSNGEPSDIGTIETRLDPGSIGHVRIRVYNTKGPSRNISYRLQGVMV